MASSKNSRESSNSIPGSLSFAALTWSKGERALDQGWGVIQKNNAKKPRMSQSYKNLFNTSFHLVYIIQLGLKSLRHLWEYKLGVTGANYKT